MTEPSILTANGNGISNDDIHVEEKTAKQVERQIESISEPRPPLDPPKSPKILKDKESKRARSKTVSEASKDGESKSSKKRDSKISTEPNISPFSPRKSKKKDVLESTSESKSNEIDQIEKKSEETKKYDESSPGLKRKGDDQSSKINDGNGDESVALPVKKVKTKTAKSTTRPRSKTTSEGDDQTSPAGSKAEIVKKVKVKKAVKRTSSSEALESKSVEGTDEPTKSSLLSPPSHGNIHEARFDIAENLKSIAVPSSTLPPPTPPQNKNYPVSVLASSKSSPTSPSISARNSSQIANGDVIVTKSLEFDTNGSEEKVHEKTPQSTPRDLVPSALSALSLSSNQSSSNINPMSINFADTDTTLMTPDEKLKFFEELEVQIKYKKHESQTLDVILEKKRREAKLMDYEIEVRRNELERLRNSLVAAAAEKADAPPPTLVTPGSRALGPTTSAVWASLSPLTSKKLAIASKTDEASLDKTAKPALASKRPASPTQPPKKPSQPSSVRAAQSASTFLKNKTVASDKGTRKIPKTSKSSKSVKPSSSSSKVNSTPVPSELNDQETILAVSTENPAQLPPVELPPVELPPPLPTPPIERKQPQTTSPEISTGEAVQTNDDPISSSDKLSTTQPTTPSTSSAKRSSTTIPKTAKPSQSSNPTSLKVKKTTSSATSTNSASNQHIISASKSSNDITANPTTKSSAKKSSSSSTSKDKSKTMTSSQMKKKPSSATPSKSSSTIGKKASSVESKSVLNTGEAIANGTDANGSSNSNNPSPATPAESLPPTSDTTIPNTSKTTEDNQSTDPVLKRQDTQPPQLFVPPALAAELKSLKS